MFAIKVSGCYFIILWTKFLHNNIQCLWDPKHKHNKIRFIRSKFKTQYWLSAKCMKNLLILQWGQGSAVDVWWYDVAFVEVRLSTTCCFNFVSFLLNGNFQHTMKPQTAQLNKACPSWKTRLIYDFIWAKAFSSLIYWVLGCKRNHMDLTLSCHRSNPRRFQSYLNYYEQLDLVCLL